MLGAIYSIFSVCINFPLACDTTYVNALNNKEIYSIMCYRTDSLGNASAYENIVYFNQKRIYQGYFDSSFKFIKHGTYVAMNCLDQSEKYDTVIIGNYCNNSIHGTEIGFSLDNNKNRYISHSINWANGNPAGVWEVYYPGILATIYLRINWKDRNISQAPYSIGDAKYYDKYGNIKCIGKLGNFSYPIPECSLAWFCFLPEESDHFCERFFTPIGTWRFYKENGTKLAKVKFPYQPKDFNTFKLDCKIFN
jgi:hypothetical protein